MLFIVVFSFRASAQMNIMMKPVNPYRFQTEDVWNITVFSPVAAQVNIQAIVSKQGLGPVYNTTCKPVTLKTGSNSFSRLLLSSERIDFSVPEIRNWVDAHPGLPPGHYSVCYTVTCVRVDCDGNGTIGADNQYCFNFVIEPPSPLLLNFPTNESVIADKTPVLSWIPPSPVSGDVRYELRLVKVRESQSRQDAISRNIPILQREGIQGASLAYPADIDPLEEGETYAWEVYANLFGERIARSEVWEFTIGKDSQEKKTDPFNYIKIRQVNPASVVNVENTLRLDYRERVSKKADLKIEILTSEGRVKGTLNYPIVYGENLMDISLTGMGLKQDEEYRVRITNELGEHYEIKIRYTFSY